MTDIVILAVIGALVMAVVPQSAGMRKAVELAAGLALLLVICRPIAEAASDIGALPERFLSLFLPPAAEMEEKEETARRWVIRYSTENIEKGVCMLVETRYALPAGSVKAEVETAADADGNLLLDRLLVRIPAESGCNETEVARFVGNMLSCPCAVTDE